MKQNAWAAVYCFAVFAAFSCSPDSTPLTQVMVVVDSDISQVDSVRVRVEGMGDPKVATAEDLAKRPLPRTVAIVYRGGPLGPITVTADALAGKATLVSRRAEFSFVRGHNLTLTIMLAQSCVGIRCDSADDTCSDGVCESSEVDATKLNDWSGKPSSHRDSGTDAPDAGAEDGGTGTGGGTSGVGGRAGGGGQAGARTAGKGGQSAGASGKPAAGSGGSPMLTCSGCAFDTGTTAPHGSVSCDNGTCLLRCDAGYTDADQARGNGCEKSASAFAWKVSNVDPSAPPLMAAIAPALVINCSATLDLGNAAFTSPVDICGQQLQPVVIPQRAGAPDLVVLATRHLSVTSGTTFRFTGARPVVIVVYGDAVIDGQLDVSAVGATAGAGSNFECTPGLGGNGASDSHAGGGGGGGFGTNGGNGANSKDNDAPGGPGGTASTDATLSPLRGGCSGGLGGQGDGITAPGGGGGGALQLSVAGKLHVSGTIAAAGGGGQIGSDSAGKYGDGGGGGGSGGAILLEAATIETVSGAWLTTNGGGGGEGRVLNNSSDPGADGAHSSQDVALGGNGSSSGGNGAAGAIAATAAPTCTSALCGGGGGGGGIGRVILRSTDCLLGGSTTPQASCSTHLN